MTNDVSSRVSFTFDSVPGQLYSITSRSFITASSRRTPSSFIPSHRRAHCESPSPGFAEAGYYRDVPAPDKGSSSGTATVQWFATTHWSVVLAAGHSERKDI